VLSTASTKILINGQPGNRIYHVNKAIQSPRCCLRSLWKPSTPSFVSLTQQDVLLSLRAPAIRHRVSLYTDDMVVFIDPTELDLTVVEAIMGTFADASGL
jgi:hypothetical protein